MDKEVIIDGVNVSKCEFYDKDKKYCLILKMYPKGFSNPSCFSGDFQECIQGSKTCPYTFCHNNPNCYFKRLQRKTTKYNKYKQTLNKIKLLVTNLISSCNKCEDNKNGYCIGIDECSSRCFRKILDIITKIKENN